MVGEQAGQKRSQPSTWWNAEGFDVGHGTALALLFPSLITSSFIQPVRLGGG
jgi:hypothetical protein